MKKTITTIAVLVSVLTACGPSKEQIAAEEKRKLDSAATAGQQQLLQQQADDQAKVEAAANQDALKQQLIDLKGQLAAAESRLDDIQKWKLGRSEDEKAQQIEDQTKVIEDLKNQIADTEKQITD